MLTVSNRKSSHVRTINKLRSTGLFLIKERVESKSRVPTEDKLDEAGTRLDHSPRRSLRVLVHRRPVSENVIANYHNTLETSDIKTIVSDQHTNWFRGTC